MGWWRARSLTVRLMVAGLVLMTAMVLGRALFLHPSPVQVAWGPAVFVVLVAVAYAIERFERRR